MNHLFVIDPTKPLELGFGMRDSRGDLVEPRGEANSYVLLSDANTHITSRGYDVTITEAHLIRAADFINAFRRRFRGEKVTPDVSNMQWPREGVFLDEELLGSDVIPQLITHAQIEAAVEIASNRDPQATTNPQTSSEQVIRRQRVGNLEIEYDTSNTGGGILGSLGYSYPKITALLQPVLTDNFLVSR